MKSEQPIKISSFKGKLTSITPKELIKTKWMILIIALVVTVVVAISSFIIYTNSVPDFREVKWGDDMKTVKEKEEELGNRNCEEVDQGDNMMLFYEDIYVDGKEAELYYYFCKSEALDPDEYLLCEAHYIFDDEDDIEISYQAFKKSLENVYGEPYTSSNREIVWQNDNTKITLSNKDYGESFYRIDYALIDYLEKGVIETQDTGF